MEILVVVVVGGLLAWFVYHQLNKDSNGRHPLDAIAPKDAAPYKVETPPVTEVKVEEKPVAKVVEEVVATPAPEVKEEKPAKRGRKKAAEPKVAVKKPAAKKTAKAKKSAPSARKAKKV